MRSFGGVVLGVVFGLLLAGSVAFAGEVCDGPLAAEGNGYQGAEFCLTCHYAAESYMQTAHPSKVQGPPSKKVTPVLRTKIDGEEVSVFDPRTAGYDKFIAPWSEYFNEENVEFTYGSEKSQKFLTRTLPAEVNGTEYKGKTSPPGNHHALMGAQWNVAGQKWVDLKGPTGKSDDWYKEERFIGKSCFGCHTTGLDPEDGSWADQNTSLMQKGISCETCHFDADGKKKIVNPVTDLTFRQRFELCGSCHGKGKSAGADGKAGKYRFAYSERLKRPFQPGDKLSDFLIQSGNPDSHPSQLYAAWMQSGHFKEEVGCLECHNPHITKNQALTIRSPGELCVGCHEKMADPQMHQRHSGHTPQDARCIDCHMPYTVKRGDTLDKRSHRFKIVPPAATIAKGDKVLNSCTSACHNGSGPGEPKTNAEAQKVMSDRRQQRGQQRGGGGGSRGGGGGGGGRRPQGRR